MLGFINNAVSKVIGSISRMFINVSGNTWYGKLLIVVGSFLTSLMVPIMPLLLACFFLTGLDMYYGIKVARKHHEKITSDKNWKGTLNKLAGEINILLGARLIEYPILEGIAPLLLTGGLTVIIGLTELWSIIENLNTLYPTGPWKLLAKFLVKKGEDYTGIRLNKKYKYERVDDYGQCPNMDERPL
jgi:hypothetical protein